MSPQVRPLDSLIRHRRRLELFSEMSQQELERLAADMKLHGLREPIEILPNGTIISGHDRERAARLLGWKTIHVVVRRDIVLGFADAGVEELIVERAKNRELNIIEQAKCFRLLKNVFGNRGGFGVRGDELRDRVAQALAFGMSGRQLDQYTALLKLPPAIQEAVVQYRLTRSLALLIARIPVEQQAELVLDLNAGPVPAEYVRRKYIRPNITTRSRRETVHDVLKSVKKLESLLRRNNTRSLARELRGDQRGLQSVAAAIEMLERLQETAQ